MGRKRNRTWKYLYLSITCMISLSIAGCATLKEMEAKRETREYLITARKLLDQGDYEGSLKENQKVLSLYDNVPPGDEALFNTGLIYAHYGYPKRDYQKSLDHFERLVKAFPQSPLARQAKIWIGILQEKKKSKQENERLKKEIEELNKTIKKSKQVDIEIDEKRKEISE